MSRCYQIWAKGAALDTPNRFDTPVVCDATVYLSRKEAERNQAKFNFPTYIVDYPLKENPPQ